MALPAGGGATVVPWHCLNGSQFIVASALHGEQATACRFHSGFGLPGAVPLADRIEDSFARQLEALPDQTRRMMQLAAADPSGDQSLVWRAAERLGIPVQAAAPAVEAGLVEFGGRVRFRHPLARSAAHRSASFTERQQMHAALAEVTDPQFDPDRRAWHRAQAAAGPDEEVAAERRTAVLRLEGSPSYANATQALPPVTSPSGRLVV